jgi:hypothetical protein
MKLKAYYMKKHSMMSWIPRTEFRQLIKIYKSDTAMAKHLQTSIKEIRKMRELFNA